MRKLAIGLLFLSATSLFASTTTYRVLVPIYLKDAVPGAEGSSWQSSFAMYNSTSVDSVIRWCSPVREDEICPLDGREDEFVNPGETQTTLPSRYPYPSAPATTVGYVVYVAQDTEVQNPPTLSFQLRVRDLSRNALSAGTEIPVIREDAFRTSTLRLLSVPLDARFRPLLRIYEMNLDTADFVVRVFDQGTGAKLSERTIRGPNGAAGIFSLHSGLHADRGHLHGH